MIQRSPVRNRKHGWTKQYHGEMDWMARHGMLRARPMSYCRGTLRVISVRMNYLPLTPHLPAR